MGTLRTLPEALAEAARTDAGYVFVAGDVETRRSYAEIRKASLGVARALREAGLRRGDLVAIVVNDAEQFLTTLLGASISGVVPASLYPPATTSDLPRYLELTAGILRTAGARAVVTSNGLVAGFEEMRPLCPDLRFVLSREQLDAPPLEPDDAPSLDDLVFVQFTSGSTSAPKGVALTHRNLSANIDAINGARGLALSADDTGLSWLPLYHDMGLVGMALGPIYCTRPVILLTPQAFVKRPAEWLRAISRYRATISYAPNFAYDLCVRRIKDRDVEGLDLSCWRVAGCGAEPIHAPTLAAFAEKFRAVGFRETSLLPSYGLAEHVLAATFPPRDRGPRVEQVPADDLNERRMAIPLEADDQPAVALVSCGLPLPGHQIRIVDEHGRELSERHVGEITLAGPSVMLGYYKDEDLTRRTVRQGWLHTGDLGYLSGGELFVCGRAKDLIIVNGRKYHPQDLEWGIDDLPGVRRGRVAAFGTAQSGGPDRVVIVVERGGSVAPGALRDAIRRRIVDLHGLYVDEVVMVPSGTVGRTTSGKLQRAAIKARYECGDLLPAEPANQAELPA
jgi:fatty-acyl-CoA synthase